MLFLFFFLCFHLAVDGFLQRHDDGFLYLATEMTMDSTGRSMNVLSFIRLVISKNKFRTIPPSSPDLAPILVPSSLHEGAEEDSIIVHDGYHHRI